MAKKEFDLRNTLAFQVGALSAALSKRFEEKLEPLGVTGPQWGVLSAIHYANAETPSAIGSYLGIDGAAITRHLDRLESKGLVTRKASPQDRRSVSIALSAKAADLMPQAAQACEECMDDALALLKKGERKEFRGGLEKLLRKLGQKESVDEAAESG